MSLIDASIRVLLEKEIITKSDEELYRFGINQLYLFCVNVITSVIIGVLGGMLWQSILFSVAYIPLRKYAGGYHARTPGRCYCLSILLIVCVLMLIKYVPWDVTSLLSVLGVSVIIILARAPSASKNKPLSDAEKSLYKAKARIILLMETVGVFLFTLLAMELAICILSAISCSAFMLVIPNKVFVKK